MMKKIIIVILEILLGSVVMAQMPVKNTIPGKEVVLLPEMSDRAFWEHCMAIEQRERIIALGSQVLISGTAWRETLCRIFPQWKPKQL